MELGKLTPKEEQGFLQVVITRHRRGMIMDNINGVLFLSIVVNSLRAGGGWDIIIAIVFGGLAWFTSGVLTNKRTDLARLRQMHWQMVDGLYLKEALNEFKPAVREYMKKNFIHSSLLD